MTTLLVVFCLLAPLLWIAVFAMVAADKPWKIMAHSIALAICGFSIGALGLL